MREMPVLTPAEVRVLGSLMEKSRTTPDYYPMTLNSLTAACNQKSSRWPVVEYDESTVVTALDGLKRHGLIASAVGGGSRVTKYKHNFGTVYPVSDAALAVMCMLFIRGPQTGGELNANSGRLHEFSSLESVQATINELLQHEPPFITEIPRQPGQKENRFAHLFSGTPSATEIQAEAKPAMKNESDLEARLSQVEKDLETMRAQLNKLMRDLGDQTT